MVRFVVYSEITVLFQIQALKENSLVYKKFIFILRRLLCGNRKIAGSLLNYYFEEMEENYFKRDNFITYNNENTKIFPLKHLEYI